MDQIELKKKFNDFAMKYGFNKSHGGWFKESEECIIVLNLQKSKYGNKFDLNIKIFVQNLFNKFYTINESLVTKDIGTLFRRHPIEFNELFNLDNKLNSLERINILSSLFTEFLCPFIESALTRGGIKSLGQKGEIFVLPAVKAELDRIERLM